MPQTARSTAGERVDAPGRRRDSDADTATEELIRGVNEAVRLTLKHGTEARPPSAVHNLDQEGTALPSLVRGNRNAGDLSPVVNLPLPRRAPTASFHALQEWEGYVVEMRATDFLAHLTDLTAGASHEQEEAIIPLTELSDRDAARMTTGSVFRWVIGYERSPAGTKKRVSQIVLRDLPAMTEADLRSGEEWARETMQAFGP